MMQLEEAIEHLKKLKKGIEVLNRFASKKDEDLIDIEAIDTVLKELDNRIPREEVEKALNNERLSNKFMSVKEHDENHIWYRGKQFISLKRFNELKTDQLNEMKILENEIDRLREENNAYKVLINNKEQIND